MICEILLGILTIALPMDISESHIGTLKVDAPQQPLQEYVIIHDKNLDALFTEDEVISRIPATNEDQDLPIILSAKAGNHGLFICGSLADKEQESLFVNLKE